MKLIVVLLISFIIMAPVTGVIWSPSPPYHHHHVIKFEEEIHGNTRITITGNENSRTCAGARREKNSFPEQDDEFYNFQEHSKEFIDEAEEKVGELKEKISEQLPKKIKTGGEKAVEVAGNVGTTVANALGMFSLGDKVEGTYKDSVVKIENWDAVDSPKRIGEDIERNASSTIKKGVEEVKETVENVKETSVNELLARSKCSIQDAFLIVSLDKIRSVMSWCHLLGFSTAYGIGVWVTFISSNVLSKYLPKQRGVMILNKINMVYFRATSYCVGASLIGYLVSHGKKGFFSNKMELFQGFNLVSALFMILINLVFLEPQAEKLIVESVKDKSRTKSVEKLQKMNTYSSTMNVSTMVVLTWHLAYIGRLLHVGH